ncbi:hypothetical protein K9E52_09815 [Staphylococcus pseudintermedius]|nr:hypothetical protein [Staphylococcus pseudintermedius]MDK4094989.1 hypothetical protein [Staphylococcus pseudintermedius]USH19032.1 hypothetical protein K9E55_08625 [Staphylococcus pseudintermedius]USJ88114.1 hypothetical protein K9E85_13070 [Staphylococcus pseudintermedius]USJ89051.1 hypothetical protein K9E52_09815 [Staphylococcus pseudintermedius]
MEYNGNYIEHMENKGKGFLPWMEKYEEEYGKMTQEWFTDSSGKVLKDLYGKYIEEGDIQLEWDCVPIATTD